MLDGLTADLLKQFISAVPRVITAKVIIIVGIIISKIVAGIVKKLLKKLQVSRNQMSRL